MRGEQRASHVDVAVDGRLVRSQQEHTQYLMLDTHPGETVSVTVVRDGRERTETITPGSRPEPDAGGHI